MKRLLNLALLMFVALGLMAFSAAPAAPAGTCSAFVWGDVCTLEDGQTLTGDMVVFGGVVSLEDGSVIQGDVVVLGGQLSLAGVIEGDLNLIGGVADLDATARIEGDVDSIGGMLKRDPAAQIEGDVRNNATAPFGLPGRLDVPTRWTMGPQVWAEPISLGFNFIGSVVWWLFRSVLWAVLALVVMLLLPLQTRRVAAAAVERPVESGGLGCLTMLVVPVILVLLAITICGIPLTIVGGALLAVAWGLGLIAVGYELGRRLTEMLKVDWAPGVTAAVGTLVLTLVTNGVAFIPCVGWIVSVIVGAVGLGAVLVTRFGMEGSLPPAAPLIYTPAPVPPVPPAPVAGPAEVYSAPFDPDLPPPSP